MVIAVPSQGKELGSCVSSTFGRSQYFILYNTDTMGWMVLDHTEVSKSDNAGIKTAQILVDQHTDVLLSCRLGGNAARVLRADGIRVYRAVQASVGQLLDQYLAGELLPLQESASICSRTIAC